MKPALLILPSPTWLTCLALFIAAAVLLGGWLLWQRRRGAITQEHTATAAIILVLTAGVLLVLHLLPRVQINSYGAMLAVGFILGTLTAVQLGKRRGVPAERILDLGLFILVGALVGARVQYVMITPNAGPIFDVTAFKTAGGIGGLGFFGGLIGGFLTGGAFIIWKRLNFLRVVDTLAPGIALGYAITRIGCFLNGCCFGTVAGHLPWAVVFPNLHDNLPRHPSQLYASLMGFAMFGLLLLLARKASLGRAGRLFMTFLVLEGIERFTMELFRQPDPSFTGHGLTLAQLVSVLLVIGGLIGWFTVPKRPAVDDAPAAPKVAVKAGK
jgi:phosphatidylglycerol:prolipoprotein diacylglycerol transferase